MTRHRHHTRARRNRRYVPRHAAWSRPRSVDQHTAAALAGDDLMALGDALLPCVQAAADALGDALHARHQAEMIADCDIALWQLELIDIANGGTS